MPSRPWSRPTSAPTRPPSATGCCSCCASTTRASTNASSPRFGLTDELDLVQGAITPRINEDYALLDNGRPVVALGDVHAVVDPVVGQGANCASYSAWQLGQTILQDPNFDERFCGKVAERRRDRVHATSDWTNLMLAVPPPQHLLEMITAMSRERAVADVFTGNFNHPERQWDILATPERTRAFLSRVS